MSVEVMTRGEASNLLFWRILITRNCASRRSVPCRYWLGNSRVDGEHWRSIFRPHRWHHHIGHRETAPQSRLAASDRPPYGPEHSRLCTLFDLFPPDEVSDH